MSSEKGISYTSYGMHEIQDYTELFFPCVEVRIEKLAPKAFSYTRKDAEGNIIEKIIPNKSETLSIEVSPIRPLNHPARRTNYVFLKFEKEVFLSQGTAAEIYVQCPIEMGIFIADGDKRNSLDWFTCDPYHSRFGLYGAVDTGVLSKYYQSQIVESQTDSNTYINCVMKITMENLLDGGYTVDKAVFPITDHNLYYKDNKAIIDSLDIKLRKRGLVELGEANEVKLDLPDWKIAPSWESTTETESMEMGLE